MSSIWCQGLNIYLVNMHTLMVQVSIIVFVWFIIFVNLSLHLLPSHRLTHRAIDMRVGFHLFPLRIILLHIRMSGLMEMLLLCSLSINLLLGVWSFLIFITYLLFVAHQVLVRSMAQYWFISRAVILMFSAFDVLAIKVNRLFILIASFFKVVWNYFIDL